MARPEIVNFMPPPIINQSPSQIKFLCQQKWHVLVNCELYCTVVSFTFFVTNLIAFIFEPSFIVNLRFYDTRLIFFSPESDFKSPSIYLSVCLSITKTPNSIRSSFHHYLHHHSHHQTYQHTHITRPHHHITHNITARYHYHTQHYTQHHTHNIIHTTLHLSDF